ncbi:hypothetical protein SCUCBS95973_003535 [Sporothrix curviconia]|uniref:N-acetyltransferase domain-containing protein n=1 Tax=Sporothrix curviconia TaxID=1260050 RepID=A0ABP0BG25_9PEZI
MSNQRSILSFFTSSSPSSTDLPKPQPQLSPRPPPPPPPPSVSRFVPPPSARSNGAPAHAPPPWMALLRHGGSPAPNLDLPPITPAYGRSILQAAGATEEADGSLVMPVSAPTAAAHSKKSKIVFPRDIHVPDLVSVNGILLPVRYPDSFYRTVADRTRIASLFNRVILGDDGEVVGGVVCRLEPTPFVSSGGGGGNGLAVYIQSLALLSPYRGRGLMADVLESIVATVKALNNAAASSTLLATTGPVVSLFAHVWTEHDDALQWYAARKFTRQGDAPVEDYYFSLRPATAWVVRRDVAPAPPPSGGGDGDNGIVSQLAALQTSQKAKDATPVPAPAPTPPLSRTTSSLSYQNKGPEMEWNDMPADMLTSASASVASSRNPSRKVSRLNLADGAVEGDENTAPPPPPPPLGSGLLSPPLPNGSQASSRSSSSTGRKKRAYPAAMFQ